MRFAFRQRWETKLSQLSARVIRNRLMNPPNAVVDRGINLRLVFHEKPQVINKQPIQPVQKLLANGRHRRWPGYSFRDDIEPPLPACIPGLTVGQIIKLVVENFPAITAAELLSPRRVQHLVRPRHIAMYLAKKHLAISLPVIGRAFRRDHSTILQNIRRIERRMATDDVLARQITELSEKLEATWGK